MKAVKLNSLLDHSLIEDRDDLSSTLLTDTRVQWGVMVYLGLVCAGIAVLV